MTYTDPDPFNHGTTSITYEPCTAEDQDRLLAVAREGWNVDSAEISRLVEGDEKNSNNYRVQESDGRVFLLKESHINDEVKQQLINDCLSYCWGQIAKVPHIRFLQNQALNSPVAHIKKQDNLYCMHNFIDGEHFDGSKEELENIAEDIAKLHKVLAKFPKSGAVYRNGPLEGHDPKHILRVAEAVKLHGCQDKFDEYVLGILDKVIESSKEIAAADFVSMPQQVIHYDLHPHNVLFHPRNKKVEAILDFDDVAECYSQRARDIAFAMHRFARTYGFQTERQNDVGVDIVDRARTFLEIYDHFNTMEQSEVDAIPLLVQDEALKRVGMILGWHYLENKTEWSFDLSKQVTTLEEGQLYSFLL